MQTGVHYIDPYDVIGFFIALAFVIFCCGCFLYGYLNPDDVKPIFHKFNEENVDLLDGFNIGHTDDLPMIMQEAPVVIQEVSIVQVAKDKSDDRLFRDCVAVLVSLGAKKGEAKITVTDFFEHHPETETVEQFIKEHFKNEH